MKSNLLSDELAAMIKARVQEEDFKQLPEDVLSALRKIAEIPSHLELNTKHLLIQAEKSGHAIPIVDPILKIMGINRRFWNQLLMTIEAQGLKLFLVSKRESLHLLIDDVVDTICNHIDHCQTEITRLRKDLADSEEERDHLKKELRTSRKDLSTLESYLSRDLQLVLEASGDIEQKEIRLKIRDIVEKSLEIIGVQVLWDIPSKDGRRCFAQSQDKGVEGPAVIRPCLLKDTEVLHQGIAVNTINSNEGRTHE